MLIRISVTHGWGQTDEPTDRQTNQLTNQQTLLAAELLLQLEIFLIEIHRNIFDLGHGNKKCLGIIFGHFLFSKPPIFIFFFE